MANRGLNKGRGLGALIPQRKKVGDTSTKEVKTADNGGEAPTSDSKPANPEEYAPTSKPEPAKASDAIPTNNAKSPK